ncbi:MAG: glycosyltransferase [Candidatus Manganitrophaceae bacterium]|nr:MAG: glycosyltransferase [Candidatus Manganitrophaceae bacterium]
MALPASYRIGRLAGDRSGTAVLTNWSMAGGRLEVSQPLEVGAWIDLELNPGSASDIPIPAALRKKRGVHARVVSEIPLSAETQEENGYAYGLAFALDWKAQCRFYLEPALPWAAHLLFTAGILNVIYLKSFNFYYFWYQPLINLYSLMISFYILSRFILSYRYRPPRDVGYQPSVTVIVACKNEEDSIGRTLDAIYRSDYPPDQMEVIAVNDGSTDGTHDEMERARERHPGLKVIHFEKNRGKRHGMAAGARVATGDILVYVDSDSFVKRETVRKLVQGFADPTVGAVCGHATVQNARKNLLTKMQEVRYFIAFRIVKAAESIFSAVTCCSGCLSAYRRKPVMEVLDTWLNQRFLGTEATFGDDRSLTNFMLRRYRVLYHSEAVCTTLVPENYRQFFRQQLRWKKSWIRESLLASTFMWKRHPFVALFFYLGVLFPIISPLVAFENLILPLIGYGSLSLLYIYGAMLMAAIYSLCYLSRFRTGMWVYGIFFSFFYMFVLVWQTYYALLTVRRNHWGTR